MTLTLAAVYAPIAFTPGRAGRLFLEFAVTLAGAVVVSGFVALTLTPMMCSKLLRHNDRPNVLMRAVERVLAWLERAYRAVLRVALAGRWFVLLLAVAVAGAGGWLFTEIKSELSPTEDRGTVMISAKYSPEGCNLRLHAALCG